MEEIKEKVDIVGRILYIPKRYIEYKTILRFLAGNWTKSPFEDETSIKCWEEIDEKGILKYFHGDFPLEMLKVWPNKDGNEKIRFICNNDYILSLQRSILMMHSGLIRDLMEENLLTNEIEIPLDCNEQVGKLLNQLLEKNQQGIEGTINDLFKGKEIKDLETANMFIKILYYLQIQIGD